MKNLSGTADKLREIEASQEHFLAMFALECIWEQPHPYDRLANDLQSFEPPADFDGGYSRHLSDN